MILLAVLAALGVGVVAGYFGSTSGLARKGKSAKEEAARTLTEAEESLYEHVQH